MRNEDATWCVNERCCCKLSCHRWSGFYEGTPDPLVLRLYEGGPSCPHLILIAGAEVKQNG